jgi:hypothetical protein
LRILPVIAENPGISACFHVLPAGNAAIGHHLLPISAAISAHLQGKGRKRVETEMTDTSKPAERRESQPAETRSEQTNLSYRYGTIGIEAVAAAVRYCGTGKASAPATPRIDQRFVESTT